MLGREATVVWVAKRPSERRRRERSSFVRRVLNKQDEGLFRSLIVIKQVAFVAICPKFNNGIYIYQFTFTSLPLNFYSSVSGCGCVFGFQKKKILANRLIWRNKGKDRRIWIPLFTPLYNSWFRKSLASFVTVALFKCTINILLSFLL